MRNNLIPYPKFIVVALIGSFLIGVNIFCNSPKSKDNSEQYASIHDSTGYVGMNTCKECHGQIYDSFIKTGMGKSFDLASKTKSSAEFTLHKSVYDVHLNFYYLPFWENDSLRIMEYRLSNGDTTFKRIETISYIVGSGQHTNSHIINTNGYLNQAPLTFYTQNGTWDLPPGFEDGGNTRFNRLIGLECMSCHNSYPEFIEGSENKYGFVDNGISCERCHGPGSTHVNNIRAGKVIDISKEIDYSIVNPAKLPIDLHFDICQRCHIQGNTVLHDNKSFFDFRPGMKLSDVMDVYMPVFSGSENEHIMASHVERLKLSKCYMESLPDKHQSNSSLFPYKNALTCITCHDPHVSVKNTGANQFNSACSNCHSKPDQNKCSEDPLKLTAKNNNCINCHMPKSGTTDIPHVTVHDHFIKIPMQDEKVESIREFIGINCINNIDPSPLSRARAFIAYYEKFNFSIEALDSAKRYFTDKSNEDIRKSFHELVQIAFLEKDFAKILNYCSKVIDPREFITNVSFDNKHAWTAYRISEAYNNYGKVDSVLAYSELAYDLAPKYIEFAYKYGNSLVLNKQYERAISIFEKILMDYPKHAPSWTNLGYTNLLLKGDTSIARNCYNKSLALDPDNTQTLMNMAGLFALQGDSLNSLRYAELVNEIDPKHAGAKEVINYFRR